MMAIDRFLALTRPMQSYHFRTRKMVKINGLQRRTALNQTLGPAKDRAVGLLRTLKLFKAFLCCLLCWALSFATSSVAVPYRELGSYEYFVSKKNEYVTSSYMLSLYFLTGLFQIIQSNIKWYMCNHLESQWNWLLLHLVISRGRFQRHHEP